MFTKDDWMTGILGVTTYHLKVPNKDADLTNHLKGQSLENHLGEKEIFSDVKLSTSEIELVSQIETLGYNLVDTNVTFDIEIEKKNLKGKSVVEKANESDREMTATIASKSFEYSRFHLDHKIKKKSANLLKEKWVENYFYGKRGDNMLLAKVGDEVAGFIQLLERGNDVIIDLIGVSSDFRRQYIAHDLMAETCNLYPNKKKIIVGTQVSNIPSVRMYENFGFRLCDSSYVFHYHT
jgi:ribosomal protein S18 acetylase RimI-like enzyme